VPAWSWGCNTDNHWVVLDPNSASDADVWIAYTLLEAGKAWNEARCTWLGTALAKRIATEEVAQIPSSWTRKAFTPMISYRLNLSYIRCRSCWDWARFTRWTIGRDCNPRSGSREQLRPGRFCHGLTLSRTMCSQVRRWVVMTRFAFISGSACWILRLPDATVFSNGSRA